MRIFSGNEEGGTEKSRFLLAQGGKNRQKMKQYELLCVNIA